jgi:hypothetical protein
MAENIFCYVTESPKAFGRQGVVDFRPIACVRTLFEQSRKI